jgi:hypothetical protein
MGIFKRNPKTYKIALIIILIIVLISNLCLYSFESLNKLEATLDKQFERDKIIVEKVISNKNVSVSYYITYAPSAVKIYLTFPKDTSLQYRAELLGEIVKEISLSKYKQGGTYNIDGSKVSYDGDYAMITSSVITLSNKIALQKGTVYPVAGFLYTGPTENYKLSSTSFVFRLNSLFLFAKIPSGFHNTTLPPLFSEEFVANETFKNFTEAPSCVIYDYMPITFYTFKLISVEHKLDISVYPGNSGIIRILKQDEELVVKRKIP